MNILQQRCAIRFLGGPNIKFKLIPGAEIRKIKISPFLPKNHRM